MFLYLVFLVAILKFGQSQNQCVREIRSLKNDLQLELRGVVREEITVSREEVQELVEDKATKDDVQALNQNLTAHLNVTREELVRLLTDKEMKEDAQQRSSELLQALNFSVATGNQVIMDALMQILASQKRMKNATTLNNSLGVIPTDQCVTRDEVRDVIRTEVHSVVRSEVESVVRSQVQSLVNYVAEIQNNNTALLLETVNPGSENNPASSCTTIPQWRPAGIYWIQGINGSASQQYCDMTRICCGRIGGWMKVAKLDMKDTNQQCPSGFRLITSPRRSCGRPGPAGCVSTTFPVHGVEYSRVCGKIIGYQDRTPESFFNNRGTVTIDGVYVNGVSLTHGSSPRKHIWTFAAARDEVDTTHSYVCPCTHPDLTYTGTVPPFIGQDYFCETGSRNRYQYIFYSEDPLWDGQGCGAQSTCCSFNNPPWFCKQLPQPTRDDIELRLCADQSTSNEDTPFEVVEIYVQ